VVFYILRDGSVGGIQVVRRSGNFAFNAQAMAGRGQAGRPGRSVRCPTAGSGPAAHLLYTFLPPTVTADPVPQN
jgi:hypothetical protein